MGLLQQHLLLLLLLSPSVHVVDALSSPSASKTSPSTASSPPSSSTIHVCTGADCQVDGAPGSLKAIQRRVMQLQVQRSKKDAASSTDILVKRRPCLGPCGDGPCALVRDELDEKVVAEQPNKVKGSLFPPEMFGDSSFGVYQVRTKADVDFVVNLAAKAAGCGDESLEEAATTGSANQEKLVTSSTRPWYDRPKNERKGLQRVAQLAVVLGLAQYGDAHGQIGAQQWTTAVALLLASDLIMKENLLQQVVARLGKSLGFVTRALNSEQIEDRHGRGKHRR